MVLSLLDTSSRINEMYNIFSDEWVLSLLQLFPWHVFIEFVLANIKPEDLLLNFYKLSYLRSLDAFSLFTCLGFRSIND